MGLACVKTKKIHNVDNVLFFLNFRKFLFKQIQYVNKQNLQNEFLKVVFFCLFWKKKKS